MPKISALDPIVNLAPDDEVPIRDVSENKTKRVSVQQLRNSLEVGWITALESWSFSSFNTTTRIGVINVPTGALTKYYPGMWVRITQDGIPKFGIVNSTTATTITVNFFNLYTLTSSAITDPLYSPARQPLGAPALPVKYTDANGWRVRDFGTFKRYLYKYLWTGSFSMTQYSNYSPPGLALPVGVATRADITATYNARCTDRTFLVNERVADTSTGFAFEVNQWHNATITLTFVRIDIEATDWAN